MKKKYWLLLALAVLLGVLLCSTAAAEREPILTASLDASSYDYADRAVLTAILTWSDGTTDGLARAYPDARIGAYMVDSSGEDVPGFSYQSTNGLELNCGFPLMQDNMEPGYYKIIVESNVEDLTAETDLFYYTADRSGVPDPSSCTVQLTLTPDRFGFGTQFRMMASVTDSEGRPAKGVKVLFEVFQSDWDYADFFSGYTGLWNVTDATGTCSIRSTRPEGNSLPEGQYFVRASIINGDSVDEKPFEFFRCNSGKCGESVFWLLKENGVLVLYGSGETDLYDSEDRAPWDAYRNKIQKISVEEGVTGIGEYAFYKLPKLTLVYMADSVVSIGSCAFRYCSALETLMLSEGLVRIESMAFEGCSSLAILALPASVEEIGYLAFASCNIPVVSIPDGTPAKTWDFYYAAEDGTRYLCHLALPSGVTTIGEGAFCDNPIPRDNPDFVLPEDLTAVEAETFAGIHARYVWIPDNVESIGSGAFASCTGLRYVRIPYSFDIGGDNVFPAGTILLGIGNYNEATAIETWAEQNGYVFIPLENPYGGNG